MAIRGVYTKDEDQMLEETNRNLDNLAGWGRLTIRTQDQISRIATSADPWNPLFNDENYARGTRWGHLIAAPFTLPMMIGRGGQFSFKKVPPSLGTSPHIYIGEDYELYKPIYVNDEFRTWCNRPQVEDVTPLDGKGLRTFKILASDITYINQRDEIVGRCKTYLEAKFSSEPGWKDSMPASMPEYVYTKEELALIDRIGKEEEVRGANIRWWEDVKVGDEPKPIIMGPTTVADMAGFGEAIMPFPISKMRRERPDHFRPDPNTGVTYVTYEGHLSDKAHRGRGGYGFHYGNYGRALMGRLVTNWMGDDGWMKAYKWRHMIQTRIGDTVVGRGRITNKRVEKGEHLVDLVVWSENFRGNTTEVASATVSLFSKKEPIPAQLH